MPKGKAYPFPVMATYASIILISLFATKLFWFSPTLKLRISHMFLPFTLSNLKIYNTPCKLPFFLIISLPPTTCHINIRHGMHSPLTFRKRLKSALAKLHKTAPQKLCKAIASMAPDYFNLFSCYAKGFSVGYGRLLG